MNPIWFFLIPVIIVAVFLGVHKFLLWNSWRKEIKRDAERDAAWDKARDKHVDYLLGVDPQDWNRNA